MFWKRLKLQGRITNQWPGVRSKGGTTIQSGDTKESGVKELCVVTMLVDIRPCAFVKTYRIVQHRVDINAGYTTMHRAVEGMQNGTQTTTNKPNRVQMSDITTMRE